MYKRLNITLPDDVLARADAFAASERYTRSGLIAAALDAFVAEGGGEPGAELAGASLAAEAPGAYAATAPDRMALSLERVSELARAFFRARDDIEAAWLFGSVARGEAGPMSDVDIAVLPVGRLDAEARWKLKLDLAGRLPGVFGVAEVDVAVLPDVSVRLGYEIFTTGVEVFGADSRAAAEAMLAAINDYRDYQPVLATAHAALAERMQAYAKGE